MLLENFVLRKYLYPNMGAENNSLNSYMNYAKKSVIKNGSSTMLALCV